MASPVAVLVTRMIAAGGLEVLVERESGRVPSGVADASEHPCEAAWRLVTALAGPDSVSTFRRLAAPGPWTVFQTALEHELAPEREGGLAWQPLASAVAGEQCWQAAAAALES